MMNPKEYVKIEPKENLYIQNKRSMRNSDIAAFCTFLAGAATAVFASVKNIEDVPLYGLLVALGGASYLLGSYTTREIFSNKIKGLEYNKNAVIPGSDLEIKVQK